LRVYNPKIAVATALSTDVSLIALIPKVRMFDGIASFTGEPGSAPYLTYEEIANIEALRADDETVEDEVTIRVHIWRHGVASLSIIASHVNRIMQASGYTRNYSQDQDEQLETGVIVKHKILSFSGTFTTAA
jgi:hypothetical protein